jgi:hypothetical protein
MMDLVTLITLCSFGLDPKLMHALVWRQSGGEPWSFTAPGERQPRVYRKLREAVREARAMPADGLIRVGLTGLLTDASAVMETTFLPCPNIAAAARQITQLTARCEATPRSDADPTFCAVAAYRGSWERPDGAFANAVRTSVATNDAPNFDMPKETGIEVRDALLDLPVAPPATPPSPTDRASDDNDRAWSSALFPAKPERSDSSSNPSSVDAPAAQKPQSRRQQNVESSGTNAMSNSLFVPRSPSREP